MAGGSPLKLEKIFPLNLTARAAMLVAGNPVTTRMESGVANCYPGLEFDHRNLDRRFFPGLVFEFVLERGARFHTVDLNDPDLDPSTFANRPDQRPNAQTRLFTALSGDSGGALGQGLWFLDSITQSGQTISVANLDGMTIWRLIRSLEAGPVSIVLVRRPQAQGETIPLPRTVKLDGWRRSFTSSDTGVISDAYLPGEMTQSLCSPWMHDFRDCACTYWASNHPDIVLAEELPGTDDPVTENTPIDWLRADRSPERTAAALPTEGQNRAAQMDHYQINKTWQDLAIVLAGHEISRPFNAREPEPANPFESADKLAAELVSLAQLEHAVTLEYLYALYSVKSPDTVKGALGDALTFVRHQILMIAVGEMRHLRWANQLIWELEHAQFVSKIGPSLRVATTVPATPTPRPPSLEALTPDILQSFVDIEKPSGTLSGAYARVLATLRLPQYSGLPMEQLAARIIVDGAQHFSSFREIQVVLQPFSSPPSYLAPNFKKAPPSDAGAKKALALYKRILDDLGNAYALGDMEDARLIADARQTMFDLKTAADQLAARGLGVPYF